MAISEPLRHLSALQLEQHVASLGRLATLTSNLRDRLDETANRLMLEHREAIAAYKLATIGQQATWKLPVVLGITKEQLSRIELARALGVTQATVTNMVADGRLPPPRKVQNRLAFLRSEIDRWVGDKPDENR